MKILMDDREPEGLVLMGEVEGMEFERKRLKVGDYVVGNVCVERKEINDFCSSLIDGRLKKQVVAMNDNYLHNFVLVSGKIGDRTSEVHEHSVLGMMASLIVKYGVNIVILDDDGQLLYFMKRLFERYEEGVL